MSELVAHWFASELVKHDQKGLLADVEDKGDVAGKDHAKHAQHHFGKRWLKLADVFENVNVDLAAKDEGANDSNREVGSATQQHSFLES